MSPTLGFDGLFAVVPLGAPPKLEKLIAII